MTPNTRGTMVRPVTHVLGLDLAGPANAADTAAAQAVVTPEGLSITHLAIGIEDGDLPGLLPAGGDLVVGLDAPLSYQPGGGDRPGDRTLRRRLIEAGLPPGTVMAPTMTRMAYLTLRGISVARLIRNLRPDARICEVHPGGAMALRCAPLAAVRRMKASADHRKSLALWLEEAGVQGVPAKVCDHRLAACAATLGAWQWSRGRAAWLHAASPPLHPHDYCC